MPARRFPPPWAVEDIGAGAWRHYISNRTNCTHNVSELATCFFFIIERTRLSPTGARFIAGVWHVVLMPKLRHGRATLDGDFGTV